MQLVLVVVFILIHLCSCRCPQEYYYTSVPRVNVQGVVCDDKRCYSDPGTKNWTNAAYISFSSYNDGELEACSIANLLDLQVIDGTNAKLLRLETNSFTHLPKLKYLHLSFNMIQNLSDLFLQNYNATPVELIDLSFNRISTIGSDAFWFLTIRALNLSRNELTHFKIDDKVKITEELILSHNFLKIIEFKRAVPSLPTRVSVLDLSFNSLDNFKVSCKGTYLSCFLRKLDLTHNQLTSFPELTGLEIERLKLGFNYIRSPEPAERFSTLNVSFLSIYPNPWECGSVWDKLIRRIGSLHITILPPEMDKRFDNDYLVCAVRGEDGDNLYNSTVARFVKDQRKCGTDVDCQEDEICRSNRCWRPCNQGVCGGLDICHTRSHVVACLCGQGKSKRIVNFSPRCYADSCTSDSDCEDLHCVINKCV